MIINDKKIRDLLNNKIVDLEEVNSILEKASRLESLTLYDISRLILSDNEETNRKIFKVAKEIKQKIYGDRIVIFAPLYISNYCVNNCTYCGYKRDNKIERKRLTKKEIQDEVMLLEASGHKRIALELGEDPVNSDIEYVLESIDHIYNTRNDNGNIRRINVNIAATSIENYRKLLKKDIGTYILFQETYHKESYEMYHPKSLKGNYNYHLSAFDRAMEAGIDDVGAGVLFGLYDYKYEIMALMMHNNYLEDRFNVGFHTISVPRIKKAKGVELKNYNHIVTDEEFKRIVAILRIAVPYTGLILSTRESEEIRKEVINYGISQISAGSSTKVGGYKEEEKKELIKSDQFEIVDKRTPLEIIKELLNEGFIPSYCTACYRSNRTGDRFMRLAKSGQIHNVCLPNALMTLKEFSIDYGDESLNKLVNNVIKKQINNIDNKIMKNSTIEKLKRIDMGERDLFV